MVVRLKENSIMLRVIVFILALASWVSPVWVQSADKAIIARTSESISLAPLLYDIEKGYYRKEDVDLEFRILREAAKDIDGKS